MTDPTGAEVVERRSVRALLLTSQRELLLMRLFLDSIERYIWIAPGGGIEPGEDAHDALRRELREETGLSACEPGPQLWRRSQTFEAGGRRVTQHERYWVVPVERFEPRVDAMPAGYERDWFAGFRWWGLDEIQASREIFVPRRLGDLLADYLSSGAPSEPIDVGL